MNTSDIAEWCDEHLPDIYNSAMFDFEEASDAVWAEFQALIAPFEDMLDDTVLDKLTEYAHSWFKEHHALILDTAIAVVAENELNQLVLQRQTPQHTTEWHSEKSECLTASEIYDIFTGSRGALLRRKLALYYSNLDDSSDDVGERSNVAVSDENGNMAATSWGHRFEPIVRQIFEMERAGSGTVLDNLGRFCHWDPAFKWLRASPDGLVMRGPFAGRLVEIKAPKTRVPGEFIPPEYWVQMQMQAEVLNLDAVEFVEAQFQQRHRSAMNQEDWASFESAKWKGQLQVVRRGGEWTYVYSNEEVAPLPSEPSLGFEDEILEHSCWWLTGFFPRTVLRDREWWSSEALPRASAFWSEYLEARKAPPPLPVVDVEVERIGWMGS